MQVHATNLESPRAIEAQLDHDRDALSAALEALRNRFSLDGLLSDGTSLIKANSGPYTHAIDAAIRANPVALTLTAVGLAWLILGRRNITEPEPPSLAGTRFEAEARWEDEGGPVAALPQTDALWIEEADLLRLRATGLFTRINNALRHNLAPAGELAKHQTDITAALAKDLRRVMARGLDTLTGNALSAAIAAREHAYSLRLAATKAATQALGENPVAAGVGLAAAGATLAALLPQSALENKILGLPRDRLLATAKIALNDERHRISQSVERVAQALIVGQKAKNETH